jgi:hypothetical protein
MLKQTKRRVKFRVLKRPPKKVARMECERDLGDCPASIDQVTLKAMEKAKVLRAIKKRVAGQRGNRAKEFVDALDASERDHQSGRVTKRKTLRELID